MNKKFCILDWQYWSIFGIIISFLFLIALYLINIKVFVISPAIFIFVVGLCIAIIHFYYNLENKIKRISKYFAKTNCLFGLSIKPKTELEYLEKVLQYVDLILVMSVEPGKSGQKFIEESFNRVAKINEIRNSKNLEFLIEVDGGINPEISYKLKKLGANMVVSGNYIFKSENKKETIKMFK